MSTAEEIRIAMSKVHRHDVTVKCPKCKGTYYAPFDKIYTEIKGACFICEEDESLAEKIFKEF